RRLARNETPGACPDPQPARRRDRPSRAATKRRSTRKSGSCPQNRFFTPVSTPEGRPETAESTLKPPFHPGQGRLSRGGGKEVNSSHEHVSRFRCLHSFPTRRPDRVGRKTFARGGGGSGTVGRQTVPLARPHRFSEIGR